MAYMGLAHIVIAAYREADGKASYSGGIRFGKAIKLEIDPQYEDMSDYDDINDTDEEQEISYADVSLNTDEIPEEAEYMMFGHETTSGEVISSEKDRSGYVGVGARIRSVKGGRRKYVAIWLHKAKFTDGSQAHETKGESISYQTPTVTGKAIPDIEGNWRTKKTFDTAKEADSWINEIAGIESEE